MNQGKPINLTELQRVELERRVRSQTLDARSVRRAKIVLLAADGVSNHEIARRLEISRGQVIAWRGRFAEGGVEAIASDLPRSGRKSRIDAAEIVRLTTQTTPEGATHWSTRTLAARLGISDTTVLKVWRAHGLKPHLVETFKVSRDPKFVEKLEDIVGLYMSPPEHALVLCCDEKSQVQALDRTQPGLPLKKGRAETMTHDYKRNGTTTLFAALEIATGRVVDECYDRHGKAEFGAFLRKVAKAYPRRQLHVVVDNYHTHKHAEIQAWLAKNPRITLHFTPTSGSWLNLVEVWFGIIERQAIRRGTFTSVRDLTGKIRAFINGWNRRKHPFMWTKTPDQILERIDRKRKHVSTTSH